MESPFNYYKLATGKNFLGRRKDITILCNLLTQGENVAICSAPKTGKASLINQALLQMRLEDKSFLTANIDMTDIRDSGSFIRRLGDGIIKLFATTPSEFTELIRRFLPDTHFVFDQYSYSEKAQILSLNWDMDDNDMLAVLRLPYLISSENDRRIILMLNEFQNLRFAEDFDHLAKLMEVVFKERAAMLGKRLCSYLVTGSQANAMLETIAPGKTLHRFFENFQMSEIDDKDIMEHVVKGFLGVGKVVDREQIKGVCALFRNNVWYVNHFFSICDHLSKGYIMEPVLIEALDMLLSIHSPRFHSMMADLTTYQVSLLKALIEGNTKFSSTEVIQRYGLNSSANVKRLKDALLKKEIIYIGPNDTPVVTDPLFEYWARKYFFHQTVEI